MTIINRLKNFFILPIFITIFFLTGCYYDNFEVINPASGLVNSCDTTSAIVYSKQITNVFSNYCNSCHSSSLANGGVILDTYSGVINSKSRIDGALRHQSGYFAMPPGTQIDECSIREVEMWLSSGAQNN